MRSEAEPFAELRHRQIAGVEARVAVFSRAYAAPIEDVWDACTNPARLRRWYTPVSGELRVGGRIEQEMMGEGVIEVCEPPRSLILSLGGGADEIQLQLTSSDDGTTLLELEHATTIDQHEIAGQSFDAIFCMGGGYYPRLLALDRLLRGVLPDGYDPRAAHLDPEMRPTIDRGSTAMAMLLDADAATSPPPGSD